jgi:hypothetical protein
MGFHRFGDGFGLSRPWGTPDNRQGLVERSLNGAFAFCLKAWINSWIKIAEGCMENLKINTLLTIIP